MLLWRRAYGVRAGVGAGRPPAPVHDRRYSDLAPEDVPSWNA